MLKDMLFKEIMILNKLKNNNVICDLFVMICEPFYIYLYVKHLEVID